MTNMNFKLPFTTKKPTKSVTITAIKQKDHKDWLKKQPKPVQAQAKSYGFAPTEKKALVVQSDKGAVNAIYISIDDAIGLYDVPAALNAIKAQLAPDTLNKTIFECSTAKLKAGDIENALLGWALAGYQFDRYKAKSN